LKSRVLTDFLTKKTQWRNEKHISPAIHHRIFQMGLNKARNFIKNLVTQKISHKYF